MIVVIVNLQDKRRRLNLNFQRGSYLTLAGERRQERWHEEPRTVQPAGRPGRRPSAERATVKYKALYYFFKKKAHIADTLISIEIS